MNIVFSEIQSYSSQIKIKDIAGRIVLSQLVDNPSNYKSITATCFEQGVYLVEWEFPGQKPQTAKLTIVR
ncbi:MAG: hypothetical protein IPL74_18960 [Bacteroidetes bacterium]|nr:hypothetical protein [Bacteroidota bacterium]